MINGFLLICILSSLCEFMCASSFEFVHFGFVNLIVYIYSLLIYFLCNTVGVNRTAYSVGERNYLCVSVLTVLLSLFYRNYLEK